MKHDYRGHDIEWRHFEFVRNSKIPRSEFETGWSADWWVLVATVICLIVALVWGW